MTNIKPRDIALVEAVLFSASEPLSIEKIRSITKFRSDYVEQLIAVLKKRYNNMDCGVCLLESGGFRLGVKQDFSQIVAELAKADLPKGLLRVLSIIACHEPVQQSDIVKIIGNRTYEYVKMLLEIGFVVEEKKGRTKLLKTTSQFETYFGTRKEELRKLIKPVEAAQENKDEIKDSKVENPINQHKEEKSAINA